MKDSKWTKLQRAGGAVSRLRQEIDYAYTEARMNLGSLLREMSGDDWEQYQELMAKGLELAQDLSSQRDVVDELRRSMLDFVNAVEQMYKATSSLVPPAPRLKEAVNSLIEEYVQNHMDEIRVEEVIDKLSQNQVRLNVQNPAAVVASLLGRHPKLKRLAKGIYAIHDNTTPERTEEPDIAI